MHAGNCLILWISLVSVRRKIHRDQKDMWHIKNISVRHESVIHSILLQYQITLYEVL